MKTALAIVCSLVLLWTQFVQAEHQAAGEAGPTPACCGCKSRCCAAKSSSESLPVSATPVSSFSQNQFLSLQPAGVDWTLPQTATQNILGVFFSPLTAAAAPLYARNCARLI